MKIDWKEWGSKAVPIREGERDEWVQTCIQYLKAHPKENSYSIMSGDSEVTVTRRDGLFMVQDTYVRRFAIRVINAKKLSTEETIMTNEKTEFEGARLCFRLVKGEDGRIDEQATLAEVAELIGAKKAIESLAANAIERCFAGKSPAMRFSPTATLKTTALLDEQGRRAMSVDEYMALSKAIDEYIADNSSDDGTKLFTVQRGKGGGIWKSGSR
jgi:hypothetical protein